MSNNLVKKRGRKAKNAIVESTTEKPPPKKRGRKPKGGKLISKPILNKNTNVEISNVILHLKCSRNDINNNFFSNNIESYEFKNSIIQNTFKLKKNENNENLSDCLNETTNSSSKIIDEKLRKLQLNLHTNNISDKKSACFWCTHEFDTLPIFIPKYKLNNSYQVYGCFCSPECAVAYLMEENIDSSSKFERYGLLNNIYSKVYNYNKNIKPAPNPHYTLEKYYGNLNISEYRKLLEFDRLFFVVDKPLTRTMPEIHEDNSEFLLKSNTISKNTLTMKKNTNKINKSSILNEKFGAAC